MKRLAMLLLALFAAPLAAQQDTGVDAPYANRQLSDSAQEAEARGLMHEIRCLQCQSQSIADSDAPIAAAMRHEVRTRIAAGQSVEAVRGWLISRYGNFVTFDPPVEPITWPLWGAPLLILLFAVWLARARFRGRGDE